MKLTRVHGHGFRAVIGEAFSRIPPRIADRLGHVQFVCGVDPIFAGVHSFETTDDGRSYRDTGCCCYPFHVRGPANRRVTTVVLPSVPGLRDVVHELGHALDHTVGFECMARPITAYAATNRMEAFAESFTGLVFPDYGDQDALGEDRETRAFFDRLARVSA